MRVPYAELLGARTARLGTVLCLGLDPDPAALPLGYPPTAAGIERFAALVLDAALPHAVAVKPNLAFFEALGSPGLAALERLRARIPVEVPVVIDAKRGDIGSTTARHATALFDVLAADAVTASPYLGAEALEPLLARAGRCVYVLCRTSNRGADELQGGSVAPEPALGWPAEPLYVRVARRATLWQARFGTVGLVVAATAPSELALVREVAPELPFLVPGVGAQGGDVAVVRGLGPAAQGPWAGLPGGGLLVNVSRGIAAAALGADDPGEALARAAAGWAAQLAVLP